MKFFMTTIFPCLTIETFLLCWFSNCHSGSCSSTRWISCIWNVDSSGNGKCYRWYSVDFPSKLTISQDSWYTGNWLKLAMWPNNHWIFKMLLLKVKMLLIIICIVSFYHYLVIDVEYNYLFLSLGTTGVWRRTLQSWKCAVLFYI